MAKFNILMLVSEITWYLKVKTSVSGLNLIPLHATLKKNCIYKLVSRSYQAFELQASCSEHVDGLLILVRKSATKKFFENDEK